MRGRFKLKWLHQNKKWLQLLLVVIPVLLVIPRLDYFSLENIVYFAPESMFLAAIIFLIIYVIKSIVMLIPISVLYIAAGVVFPTGWAIVITYICLIVALSFGYFIGKNLGKNKLNSLFERHEKIADFLEERKDNLSTFCLMSRLVRMQFDMTNMVSGALDVPFTKFLGASLLGLTPAVIPYVIAGTHIYDPLSTNFLLPLSISLFISLLVVIARSVHKRQVKKKVVKV